MQIMDILGQVVMEFEIKEEEISKLLDISSLPSGVYLLQSGRTVQKFVKE